MSNNLKDISAMDIFGMMLRYSDYPCTCRELVEISLDKLGYECSGIDIPELVSSMISINDSKNAEIYPENFRRFLLSCKDQPASQLTTVYFDHSPVLKRHLNPCTSSK